MGKSDVFLRKNRVEVVGGGGEEFSGGREQGDLEVTVGKNEDPSVTLNADRANVTLGGGAGKAPEGDVKLLDQSGTQRVQISAEFDQANETRKDNAVTVDGGTGTISLASPGNQYGTLEPSAELSPGNLRLAPPGSTTPQVTLDAATGDVDVGGKPGEAGEITIRGEQDDEAVTISASGDAGKGARVHAGNVDLYNTPGLGGLSAGGIGEFRDGVEAGVQIHGPMASIRLGYSFVESSDVDGTPDPDGSPGADGPGIPTARGKSGSIFLDDGDVGKYGFGQSMVFEVRASEGKLQVAADSNRLFEIDPSAGKIKVPKGWSLDDSLPKYNP